MTATGYELAKLKSAYANLLRIPVESELRTRLQTVLATLRDEIAAGDGKHPQETQDYFEALALGD